MNYPMSSKVPMSRDGLMFQRQQSRWSESHCVWEKREPPMRCWCKPLAMALGMMLLGAVVMDKAGMIVRVLGL